jgi:hypothetical protein
LTDQPHDQPSRGRPSLVPPPVDQPTWTTYLAPMRPVRDGYDLVLHQRDWEGQRAAAERGPMGWGFVAFFGGYGGFYLASLLITTVLAGTLTDFDVTTPSHAIGPVVLVAFAPNLLLGLVPAIMSWWKGQGLRRDYGIVPTFRDVRIGLICGGLALGVGILVNLLLVWLTKAPPTAGNPLSNLGALSGGRSVWLAIAALFVFIGAPLTEEMLVRGALWGALEHYKVHRYAILALTALMFAFMHQDPQRTVALFCQGLALGGARMITGRIGSSMIAHATNNLLPALLLFFVAG